MPCGAHDGSRFFRHGRLLLRITLSARVRCRRLQRLRSRLYRANATRSPAAQAAPDARYARRQCRRFGRRKLLDSPPTLPRSTRQPTLAASRAKKAARLPRIRAKRTVCASTRSTLPHAEIVRVRFLPRSPSSTQRDCVDSHSSSQHARLSALCARWSVRRGLCGLSVCAVLNEKLSG